MVIVAITAQYPAFDFQGEPLSTDYLHQYMREFVEIGHTAHVYHVSRTYPSYLFTVLRVIGKYSGRAKNLYALYSNVSKHNTMNRFQHDGVAITRYPIKKYKPHGLFPRRGIRKAMAFLLNDMTEMNIKPDILICDFCNPSWLFAKPDMPYPTVFVPHTNDINYLSNYERFIMKVKQCHGWLLFRSERFKELNKRLFEHDDGIKTGLMLSGVPSQMVQYEPTARTGITRIISVAHLIDRKKIDLVIKALKISGIKDYTYEIVGDGPSKDKCIALTRELGLEDNCVFSGECERDEVFRKLRDADCFILLSINETFGMVYIEAMSQGCITIGTRGEGIDGVIIDGVNGYLVNGNDVDALAELLRSLDKKDPCELRGISMAAYATVKEMTHRKLAEQFLATVTK